jgi:LacI family transcriptional regulator
MSRCKIAAIQYGHYASRNLEFETAKLLRKQGSASTSWLDSVRQLVHICGNFRRRSKGDCLTVFQVPKVALLWASSSHFGRELLRGSVRYSRLHGPWSLYICGGDFEQGLPDVEFNGVIAGGDSLDEVNYIKSKGIPAVIGEAATGEVAATNPLDGLSKIVTHSPAIARVAADHFISQGLRTFAFCGFENCPWSLKREEAFAEQIAAHGYPCSKHRIKVRNWQREGDWVRAWGKEQSHLAAWLKSLPRLTGLMACNDMCGRHVLEACREAGVRVPEQVAVVGVDNDDLTCELCHLPLSSVALDVGRAGYEAARLLDGLMSGEITKGEHIVSVNPLWVVVRRSSHLIVKDDPLVADALHFIEDHTGRGIRVPDVVGEMGVSRRTLERKFSHALGRSVLSEIKRARLDRAKQLLQETRLPVYRVANEAGFASARMLNRTFRRMEGSPPATFRQHLKEDAAAEEKNTAHPSGK